MLRITTEEKCGSTTFHLEGQLIGEWVGELERCWARFHTYESHSHFLIDLSEVVFVDDAGKALLRRLIADGAELGAKNPFMRLVIEQLGKPVAVAHA